MVCVPTVISQGVAPSDVKNGNGEAVTTLCAKMWPCVTTTGLVACTNSHTMAT